MPKLPRSTLAPARTEVLREGRRRHDLVLLHAELLRDDASQNSVAQPWELSKVPAALVSSQILTA